jgi:hypothetical protein
MLKCNTSKLNNKHPIFLHLSFSFSIIINFTFTLLSNNWFKILLLSWRWKNPPGSGLSDITLGPITCIVFWRFLGGG